MAGFKTRPPLWFRVVAAVLTAWNAIGCYLCYQQFKLGADWMANATDYDRQLMASMPDWYNWCYALAVGAGFLGGVSLLARSRAARPLFIVSLVAVVVQFGYVLGATDLIAVKGFGTAAGFPVFITAIAIFAVWLAGSARRRGWIG